MKKKVYCEVCGIDLSEMAFMVRDLDIVCTLCADEHDGKKYGMKVK